MGMPTLDRLKRRGPFQLYEWPVSTLNLTEISRKIPFARKRAHSASATRGEAPPGAEAFAPLGGLSERSRFTYQLAECAQQPFWGIGFTDKSVGASGQGSLL